MPARRALPFWSRVVVTVYYSPAVDGSGNPEPGMDRGSPARLSESFGKWARGSGQFSFGNQAALQNPLTGNQIESRWGRSTLDTSVLVAGRGRLRRLQYVVSREELANLPVRPGLLRETEAMLTAVNRHELVGHSDVSQRLV